jgi:hypothetical protein
MSHHHTTTAAFRNRRYCASDAADRRFERDVTRLHRLGKRVVCAALREIGVSTMHMTTVEATVARYARLDPEVAQALGADQFPPYPDLRLVRCRDEHD